MKKMLGSIVCVLALCAVASANDSQARTKELPAALKAMKGKSVAVLSRSDAAKIRGEGCEDGPPPGSCPDTHKNQKGLGHQKCKTNYGHTKPR